MGIIVRNDRGKLYEGMALVKPSVSINALIGNEKFKVIVKNDVRGLLIDNTLIAAKVEGGLYVAHVVRLVLVLLLVIHLLLHHLWWHHLLGGRHLIL